MTIFDFKDFRVLSIFCVFCVFRVFFGLVFANIVFFFQKFDICGVFLLFGVHFPAGVLL